MSTNHVSRRSKTKERGAPTQQRILNTAAGMFINRGYDGTTLTRIAKEVNISAPALYWYFDSKGDLFVAAMEKILTDFVESVDSAVTAETPAERLRQFCRAHVLWQLEQRNAARAYAASFGFRELVTLLPTTSREHVIRLQRAHVQSLREILASGEASGVFVFDNLRVTAFAIITLCEYVFSWFNFDGKLSPENVAEHYSRLVLAMVGANVTPPTAGR